MTRQRLLLLLLVATAATSVLMLLPGSNATAPAPVKVGVDKAQLLAYEEAVVPIVQDGGRIVQQGMKPAIDDLQYRHVVPAPVIATEADAWLQSLASIRTRLAAVSAPPALRPPTQTFLTALDGYRKAAELFRQAALAPAGAQRTTLVTRGLDEAENADRVYDRGAAVVQDLRHRLGLDPSPYFPEGSGA